MPRTPLSTYRIQFNQGFQFREGAALVPYLRDLGITDLYASPIFKARAGSAHGYDVVDPTVLSPELGGEGGFEALVKSLHSREMGLLLDIVPNHQAADTGNPRWMDVLGNGQDSVYARMFDIDWDPPAPGLKGRVLIPVLSDLYGRVLEDQKLSLGFGPDGFIICYGADQLPLTLQSWAYILESAFDVFHPFLARDEAALLEIKEIIASASQLTPFRLSASQIAWERAERKHRILARLAALCAQSPAARQFLDWTTEYFNGIKSVPATFDLLDHLLDRQSYRLAFWRMTSEAINYRRFFDINHLVCVRIEDPEVFAETHRLILRLAKDGAITGLRVDHIDGMADPLGYLRRLQEALAQQSAPSPLYVVVEKVLLGAETLPEAWATHGTTGYDFLNAVNGLFVDPRGLAQLRATFAQFTGLTSSFEDLVYDKKEHALHELFNAELQALGRYLAALAERDRLARDIPPSRLLKALAGVSACLPVYRTYLQEGDPVSETDRGFLYKAIETAARRDPSLGPEPFKFLERIFLCGERNGNTSEVERLRRSFVTRWQQLTGPLAAKGVEDTALFVYNPLLSLNEVGGDGLAVAAAEFHSFIAKRARRWPHALNATSTHDTKRSEDVRARISVLSEMPGEWTQALEQWSRCNRDKKTLIDAALSPDANEEVMVYQTLLGAWPFAEDDLGAFENRMRAFVVKALREAEIHSSWLYMNEPEEQALQAFVEALFRDRRAGGFLESFLPVQRRVAYFGAINSLAQTLLKIVSPGVPDFYQGTETWRFSLVDPDNRRPVRFDERSRLLRGLQAGEARDRQALVRQLLLSWQDGRIKLYLVWKALALRNAHARLFEEGEYLPIQAAGAMREHVVALARRLGDRWVVAAVPRLVAGFANAGCACLCAGGWDDTALDLPSDAPNSWTNALTGEAIHLSASRLLSLRDILAGFPVCLMEGE